jgi:hypothetical protein
MQIAQQPKDGRTIVLHLINKDRKLLISVKILYTTQYDPAVNSKTDKFLEQLSINNGNLNNTFV